MDERSMTARHGPGKLTAAVLAGVLLILGACADGGETGPASATVKPSLDWATSIDGDTITVTLTDSRAAFRVDKVSLIGPAGQSVDAFELSRESTGGRGGSPNVSTGVGVGLGSGGGTSAGIGFGFPLGTLGGSRRVNTTQALIRVPNLEDYRRTVANWQIIVDTTDTRGSKETAEFPAPIPSDG